MHRQIAIVFKTPPYQDQDITEEVEVSVALRRLSDQMESEPITFTYLPHNPGESDLYSTVFEVVDELTFTCSRSFPNLEFVSSFQIHTR